MRALPLVLLALSAAPAMADPLNIKEKDGSPAIKSQGSSSTAISVLGGSAKVTVQGSGKLNVYTHSGTVSGEGNLGVPELGVSLGGALDNGSIPTPTGPGEEVAATGPGEEVAAPQEGAVAVTGDAALVTPDQCMSLPPQSMDASTIARLIDSDTIAIVPACDGDGVVDAAMLDAIEGNAALMAVLAGRGYEAGDVLAIDGTAEGGAALFVSPGA